jgi:LacI family transcriptional regulator, galactose operon repressor
MPISPGRGRRAAAELGYRLNTTASALARGALDSIGFVSPDPTNPFFSMVLGGLTRKLTSDLSVTVLMPYRGEDYDMSTIQRALAGPVRHPDASLRGGVPGPGRGAGGRPRA